MARAEMRVLSSLLRGLPSGESARERLAAFYGPQARDYDRFRERLLHGRAPLFERLAAQPGERLVELGAGTGRNVEFLGEDLAKLERVWLVDLCAPLLEIARSRVERWPNVTVVDGDATSFAPTGPVDIVVLSYALTMIPDWFLAVDNALAMLRPGGRIAVTDFYVSRRHPEPGRVRHGAVARGFWPLWFGHDGVHPSPDHLPYLTIRTRTLHVHESAGSLPWIPGVRVPYYVYLGEKPG